MKDALNRAVALAGVAPIAKACGISPQAVSQWDIVPAEKGRVLNVAEATNWQVTPHELRPDIYRHPDDGLPDHLRCKQKEAA